MIVRKFKKSEDGVVGIVVAILLIGLLVSVVSLLQLAYVPKWMEQIEAEHMDEVSSQFANLKFAIDTQSANEQKNTPIATSITLGSRELPFLVSSRAFGLIEILSETCTINITYVNQTGNMNTSSYPLGIIKYSSVNAYFLDQSYIYETGALITSQSDGNMISIKPSFSISTNATGVNIAFNMVNISGVGGKISNSGYGSSAILTEFSESDNTTIHDVQYINITTSYPNAWNLFLNWSLKKELDYGNDFSIEIVGNEIIIEFMMANNPTINLRIITILGQIGPGWIE